MASRCLSRRTVTVAAVAVAAPAGSSPAWASDTVTINPGNVPTTAVATDVTHGCAPNQGGGPFPDRDVWIFVLPGNHGTSGDFVSVTATFAGHPAVTVTAAANPANFRA